MSIKWLRGCRRKIVMQIRKQILGPQHYCPRAIGRAIIEKQRQIFPSGNQRCARHRIYKHRLFFCFSDSRRARYKADLRIVKRLEHLLHAVRFQQVVAKQYLAEFASCLSSTAHPVSDRANILGIAKNSHPRIPGSILLTNIPGSVGAGIINNNNLEF